MSELSEGQAMTKAWKDTEQPAFKVGQWVEDMESPERELFLITNQINADWFNSKENTEYRILTLRAGDYGKTEGMTEEAFKQVLKAFERAGLETYEIDEIGDIEQFKPELIILVWRKNYSHIQLDAIHRVRSDCKRLLTIEQILSTLPEEEDCKNCHVCLEGQVRDWMILCPTCRNKRCPKASNHILECTNSNEPGQEGSVYSELPTVHKPASVQLEPENRTQIDWTKPIQVRDGRKAVFIAVDEYGYHVAVNEFDVWSIWLFSETGKSTNNPPSDIINVPEERKLEGFLNIHAEGYNYLATRERADKIAARGGDRLACIDLGKHNITYTEGEGL